jgi:hypothetical protein
VLENQGVTKAFFLHFNSFFSCVILKIGLLYIHESERDKDQKTNSFHEVSPFQDEE